MMKRVISLSFLAIMFFSHCETVPVTGRQQLSLVPNSELIPMSFNNYTQVLAESKLSTDIQKTAMIKGSGKKIQAAVERYMSDNDLSESLEGYEWEYNLIESEQLNAWCMPGGKVAFYTGILPVCHDETGVAVVMGHEIAHAIANHGRERMSQGMLQQFGSLALTQFLNEKPAETQQLFQTAYGYGTQLVAILPFSRLHESEADKLGLIFMAMAGYNPREAPKLWERMKALSGGNEPPEFVSTHPSNDTRIKELNEYMPEALKYYQE